MSHPQDLPTAATATDVAGSPSPSFRCSFARDGVGAVWVHATGELDLAGVANLESTLADAQSVARLVVLDLRDLEFIDVAGVHAIVNGARRAQRAARRLAIAYADPVIRSTFALMGLSETVEFLDLRVEDESPPRFSRREP